MTATITIENLDREDLRLIYAALRDKREQVLVSKSANPDGPCGLQSHRLATLADHFKQSHDKWPTPKATATFIESNGSGDLSAPGANSTTK
jgi:hypothetical protein